MLTLNRFDEVAWTFTSVPLEADALYLPSAVDSILSDNFTWEEICIIENYLENKEDNDNDVILKAAFQHANR
jgi:hypothetical protein